MKGEESILGSSDEIEEMYCELCKTKGRSRTAEGFCVDCVKYFCLNCLVSHSDFLPTHILMDKTSMPQDACVKPCPKHADEIIKFYCSSCDKMFCSLCNQNDHVDCTTVSHLPTLVRGIDITQKFNEITEKLASSLREAETKEGEVNLKKTNSRECADKARAALKKKKREIRKWLETNVKAFEEEIKEIQILDEKALESEGAEFAELKIKATTFKTGIIDRQKMSTNRCELFMALKDAEFQHKQLEERLKQVKQHSITRFEFKPSEILNEFLTKRLLGYLEEEKMRDTTLSFTVEDISKLTTKIYSKKVMLYGLPWQIMAEEQMNNYLGIFLVCNQESESTSWSCKAKAEIRIINQKKHGENFTKEIQHTFSSKQNDWGYAKFISWNVMFFSLLKQIIMKCVIRLQKILK